MPEVIWRGTNGQNITPGRDGHQPIAIVNHLMFGTLAATRVAFCDPAHQASATFGIGKNGEIDQYVNIGDMPWANGPVRNPNLAAVPWIDELCVRGGANPNQLTISIEWEGAHKGGKWVNKTWQGLNRSVWVPGNDGVYWQPTPAQYAAGLWLHKKLCAELGIAPDRAHITRHSDFDSVFKGFCPGSGPGDSGFQIQRLLDDLNGGSGASGQWSVVSGQYIGWNDRPHADFPVLGTPTISPQVFANWLAARNSPVLTEADALSYFNAVRGRGINPALALAMFHHESGCATDKSGVVVRYDTKNWGNLRPRSDGSIGRATGIANTPWGRFRVYGKYMDGLLDWCDLLFLPIYAGKSIRDVIDTYAPSSDNNSPRSYTNAVLALITAWDKQSGDFDL